MPSSGRKPSPSAAEEKNHHGEMEIVTFSIVLTIRVDVDQRHDDVDRAKRGLFPSLIRFGFADLVEIIHIVCPASDSREITEKIIDSFPQFRYQMHFDEDMALEIGFDEVNFARVPGWFKQQLMKLAVVSKIHTDVVLILDADVIAIRRIFPKEIKRDAVPYQKMGAATFRGWFQQSAAALGVDFKNLEETIAQDGMGVTPEFVSPEVVRSLISKLSICAKSSDWGPYLMGFFQNYEYTWTEFSLYWIWYKSGGQSEIKHVPADLYRFIQTPEEINRYLVSTTNSWFLVLHATKLTVEDCRPVYDTLAEDKPHDTRAATVRTSAFRRTLWLIPGAHKTGTTMIQNILESNRARLERIGVYYMDRESFYESDLRKYLSEGIYYDGNSISVEAATASLLDLTGGEGDYHTSIVFVENIFGEPLYGIWTQRRPTPALYPGFALGLTKLASVAASYFDLNCMYFIRRQDQFLESLYLQCIYNGFDVSEKEFLELLMGCNLSWKRIVDLLQTASPDRAVTVIPYELLLRGKEVYLRTVLTRLGLNDDLSEWKMNVYDNPSLSLAGLKIAQAAYPFMDKAQRADLMTYLKPRYNTKNGKRFAMFDDKFRAALMQQFREENLELLRRNDMLMTEIGEFYSRG